MDKHSGHNPGPRATWLEAGQAVTAEVTIAWDDENMRVELLVEQLTEGQKASPMTLLWGDGAIDWVMTKTRLFESVARPLKRMAHGTSQNQVATRESYLML